MDMLHIDSNMTASIVLNKRNVFIKTEASLTTCALAKEMGDLQDHI